MGDTRARTECSSNYPLGLLTYEYSCLAIYYSVLKLYFLEGDRNFVYMSLVLKIKYIFVSVASK